MGFENGKLLRVSITVKRADGLQSHANVWHYDLIDAIGLPANDPQTLADLFRDDVIPKVATLYNASWSVQPVIVMEERDPQNPNEAREEWTSGAAVVGTGVFTGDILPDGLCSVATIRTKHIGRRYTGRKFLLGKPAETHWTANAWDPTWLQFQQAYLDAVPRQPDLASGISDSKAELVVYSRTQRAADNDPYASPVTSMVLHTQAHWLESRSAQAPG